MDNPDGYDFEKLAREITMTRLKDVSAETAAATAAEVASKIIIAGVASTGKRQDPQLTVTGVCRGVMSGVLLVESLAQLGAAAVLADQRFAGRLPLFGGIDKARFRRQVVPGDVVELEVTLGRLSVRAGTGQGTASVGGQLACATGLFFVFADG